MKDKANPIRETEEAPGAKEKRTEVSAPVSPDMHGQMGEHEAGLPSSGSETTVHSAVDNSEYGRVDGFLATGPGAERDPRWAAFLDSRAAEAEQQGFQRLDNCYVDPPSGTIFALNGIHINLPPEIPPGSPEMTEYLAGVQEDLVQLGYIMNSVGYRDGNSGEQYAPDGTLVPGPKPVRASRYEGVRGPVFRDSGDDRWPGRRGEDIAAHVERVLASAHRKFERWG